MKKPIKLKFDTTFKTQIEILPRLTIVYREVISLEWLWFCLYLQFGKTTDNVYSEHLRIGSSGTANTLKEMLAEDEKRIIDTSMMKHNSDKQAVMEELDISRTVLYEKLKKYGIK